MPIIKHLTFILILSVVFLTNLSSQSVNFYGDNLYAVEIDNGSPVNWTPGTSQGDILGAFSLIDGHENSQKITDAFSGNNYAAEICMTLTENGYDDWYLPSIEELDAIYANLGTLNINPSGSNYYWSSTEYQKNWTQAVVMVKSMQNGIVQESPKTQINTHSVICVRRELGTYSLPIVEINNIAYEIHPTDNAVGAQWSSTLGNDPSTNDDDGLTNTSNIVDVLGTSSHYAARVCKELNSFGHSDWFLPSANQIEELQNNLNPYPFPSVTVNNANYWTSSGTNGNEAKKYYLPTNSFSSAQKWDVYKCRCIRESTGGGPTGFLVSINIDQPVSCSNSADGALSLNLSNPNYIYEWNEASLSGHQVTGLSAGVYSVTVTNPTTGDTTSNIIDLQAPPPLIANGTVMNMVSPSVGNDGVASVSVSGGIAPYSYLWSNGDNSFTASNLDVGFHTVTVTDANNCLVVESVFISFVSGNGGTIYSKTGFAGDWSSSGTWIGGIVPTASNNVVIQGRVKLEDVQYCHNFTIESTGEIYTAGACNNIPIYIGGDMLNRGLIKSYLAAGSNCSSGISAYISNELIHDSEESNFTFKNRFYVAGNFTVLKDWEVGKVWFIGSSDQNITSADSVYIRQEMFLLNSIDTLRLNSPIRRSQSDFQLGNGILDLNGFTLLTGFFTNGHLINPNEFGDKANGEIHLYGDILGSFIVNENSNFLIRGVDAFGNIHNKGVIGSSTFGSGTKILNVYGNIENEGLIMGAGPTCFSSPYLFINVSGNITNKGEWVNCSTFLNGVEDQYIYLHQNVNNFVFKSNLIGNEFQWTKNGIPVNNSNTPDLEMDEITIDDAGIYQCFSLNEESRNIIVLPININSGSSLNGFISADTSVICNGSQTATIDVQVANGVPPYTYNWSPSGLSSANNSGLGAGIYGVTVTDAIGNSMDTMIVISEPTPINTTVGLSHPTSNQANGAIQISVIGGTPPYSYLWNTGNNQPILDNIPSGQYIITITDANECEKIETIELEPFNFGITTSGVFVLCEDEDIELSAFGGTSYLWNTGETSANIVVSEPGTYSVVVSIDNGQSGLASEIVTASVNDTTYINYITCMPDDAGIFTQTFSNQFGCDSVVIINAMLGANDSTFFVFSSCNPDEVGSVSSLLTNQFGCDSTIVITTYYEPLSVTEISQSICEGEEYEGYTQTGFYSDEFISEAGCDSIRNLTLTVLPKPDISITLSGSSELCNGDNVELTASGGDLYNWYLNDDFLAQGNSIVVSQEGNYSVVVSLNNCVDTANQEIIVHPLPDVPLIMQNNDTLFSTPASSFQWYLDGVLLDGETMSFVTPVAEGNYTVEITDQNGCSIASDIFTDVLTIKDLAKIEIFPNPASYRLLVKIELLKSVNKLSLRIFNNAGQIVQEKHDLNIINSFIDYIDIGNLPGGTYLLEASLDDVKWIGQFVISR